MNWGMLKEVTQYQIWVPICMHICALMYIQTGVHVHGDHTHLNVQKKTMKGIFMK